MVESAQRSYTTAEVAARLGVHRDTLLRWLRENQIPEPGRDRHGWRAFTEEQVNSIECFVRSGQSVPPAPHLPVALDPIRTLEAIDWDFAGAKTNYLTHSMHPYPAKFIPQIPNALIQELSSVGETVADIFCGCGTTLVEALTLKRNAIGLDANPLACLITSAKTTILTPEGADYLRDLSFRAAEAAEWSEDRGQGHLFHFGAPDRPRQPTIDEQIEFWFEPFIVDELHRIRDWCNRGPTDAARTVALTAFSSIIVSVSRQDSDTRYVRRDKKLCPGDALRRFARAVAQARHAVCEFAELAEPRFTCRVHHADILTQPDIGPVDLVVCSPPYPNAYSYHLYHMTRMLWLGLDQPTFKKVEIGSHRKYSRKGANRATVQTFRSEMESILTWLSKHLKVGRYACFVVGDSILDGQRVSNADLISGVARAAGYSEVSRIERRMQDTKKAFNPAIGKIKREQIVILRNAHR